MKIKILLILTLLSLLLIQSSGFAQYTHGGLFSAARAGNKKAVLKFLANEKDQNTLDQALGTAIVGNQFEIMKILAKHGADLNHKSSYNTPLLINTVMYNHFDAALLLLKLGADPNARGYSRKDHGIFISWNWTPLMCAAYKGDIKLTKALIKKGAIVNDTGWSNAPNDSETALDIAAYSGHSNLLPFLIRRGAKYTNEAVFKVIRGGKLGVAALMLAEEKNINRVGHILGKTVLMEAASWGHIDLINLILEHGADLNTLSPDGYTALGYSLLCDEDTCPDKTKIVKLLIKKGADVNKAGRFKMTPLMSAINSNNDTLTKLLIKNGARKH